MTTKKTYKNYPKTINKMAIRTYIAIITSHVNGLNALKDIKWLKAKLKKRILPIEDSDLKTYIY